MHGFFHPRQKLYHTTTHNWPNGSFRLRAKPIIKHPAPWTHARGKTLRPSYVVMACSPSRASTPKMDAGMSSARTGNESGWYVFDGGILSSSLGGRSIDASSSASCTDSWRASTSPTSLRPRRRLLPLRLVLVLRRTSGGCGTWAYSDTVRLESLSVPLPDSGVSLSAYASPFMSRFSRDASSVVAI